MRLNRSNVRPLFVVVTFSLAGALAPVGCTGDEATPACEGAACLAPVDASLDVARTDADSRRDADTVDSSQGTDAANTDSSVNDAGDGSANDATTTDASDAAVSDASDASVSDASDAGADASDAGGPVPLATGLNFPWRIAAGGGYVYVTVTGASTTDVVKIPAGGGTPVTVSQGNVDYVAADATNVYYVTSGGIIYKRGHAAAMSTAISNSLVALQSRGLYLSATHVYWTEFTNGGAVKRVAIDGSSMAGETVQPSLNLPNGVAFAGSDTYFAESAGNTGNGRLLRLNTDGGAPVPLATNRTGPSRIVTDGSRLYWYEDNIGSGPIHSIALTGGAIAQHANTAIDPSLVIDGSNFYYANASGGIVKINVGASSSQTLYSGAQTGQAYGMAIMGNQIYWTNFTQGRVMTAPK